ncbi:prephenate dehydrogenase [Pullulanibacillus pueri]|uniref:Prephenate dehydrogenase n=1 Tax=Pullulanibacillus pueri TaxID=1437324 RepID=A0A8J2ZUC6_9BACL|nr:prephenate dehydrogenase [Pullulanibacillus pueri]MBM7681455.1 prephenate dehydrogenase [Pullulanibacillus pueri]GGH78946.1 prephenate dehydrogenase [Pullulanibacillus pueri]
MNKSKVFVIGLGLIGGSLAKALKGNETLYITGFDPKKETMEAALDLGVIDRAEPDIPTGASEADLIILSAPISGILDTLDVLAKVTLKPGVIITDTGSTKRVIRDKANQVLGSEACYIGGHPMAGSHKSGVFASKADLFENAFYFITPEDGEDKAKIRQLEEWLSATRAKMMTIDPETHDQVVGIISHFPHIVASALVHQLNRNPANKELDLPRLAAGGFRDITRIASSDPYLWQDITMHNHDVLLKLFDDWEQVLHTIKQQLVQHDSTSVYSFFEKAKNIRDQFPVKKTGILPPSFDLYLDIPDEPCEISKVTGIIGKANISIININVIELRESVSGVLRLFFQSESARDQAMRLLKDHHYNTYLID